MGGDGGVIATQRKFVRGAKDADAVDDKINVRRNQRLRTTLCVQSQQVSFAIYIKQIEISI